MGDKGFEVQLGLGGHAPVAASRKTQRYRNVPLMANRDLLKIVIMLLSHTIGLVTPIMQLQTLCLVSREASRGLRGPVIPITEGNERLP